MQVIFFILFTFHGTDAVKKICFHAQMHIKQQAADELTL